MKTLMISALLAALSLAHGQEATKLFNGKDLEGWKGEGYEVVDGAIVCTPKGRNLMTSRQYTNYVLEFEFLLPPAGNNGLGIHYPGTGNPAFSGMELQILDNDHPNYVKLLKSQYHGSIYKLQKADRGALKPVGEWNHQKVTVNGPEVTVKLNGTVINKANLDELAKANPDHKGVQRRSGHICFCGHGDPVQFKNITLVELPDPSPAK